MACWHEVYTSNTRQTNRPEEGRTTTVRHLKRQANKYWNMNKTEGYDEMFDPPLKKNYECPICLLGLREPVQTECGHRFCRACILRSLREVGFKCPVDNVPLTELGLYPDNFAKREMNSFTVRCRLYEKRGCPWKGSLKHLEDHMIACPFSDVQCPNACGIIVQLQELEKHMEEDCPNRTMECPFCHQNIFVALAEDHMIACPFSDVQCPNACGIIVQLQELEKHMEEDCPNRTMECPFCHQGIFVAEAEVCDHLDKCPMMKSKCPALGCNFEGYNPEVSKHIAENHVQKLQEERTVTSASVHSAGPSTSHDEPTPPPPEPVMGNGTLEDWEEDMDWE